MRVTGVSESSAVSRVEGGWFTASLFFGCLSLYCRETMDAHGGVTGNLPSNQAHVYLGNGLGNPRSCSTIAEAAGLPRR